MNQATAILRSVTTLADLLDRFGLTIAQAVDTERVFILLPELEFYAQRFPAVIMDRAERTARIELHKNQSIIEQLIKTRSRSCLMNCTACALRPSSSACVNSCNLCR